MALRKTFKKRLSILLLGLCVVGGVGGGLYAYRTHRIAVHYSALRAQALAAASAGDASHALPMLGTYLAHSPDDVEVLAAYAKASQLVETSDDSNVTRAMWALRRLLRLDPSRLDARAQTMSLYSLAGCHAEALDCANIILTSKVDSVSMRESIEALGLQDDLPAPTAAEPDLIELRGKLEKSFRSDSMAVEAIATRARALYAMRNFPLALDACDLWVNVAPDNVEPALLRVELLQDNHRSQQEALDLAEKWVKANPSVNTAQLATDGLLLKGHSHLIFGDVSEARTALTQAASGALSTRLAMQALIGDLTAVREADSARALLGRMVAADPSNDAIRFQLVDRDWETGRAAEVVDLVSKVHSDKPLPSEIVGLQGTALVMLGRKPDAVQVEQTLGQRSDDSEAQAWSVILKQMIDRQANPQVLIDAVKPVLRRGAENEYLRSFIADAYLRLGERESAAREWQHVIEQNLTWVMPALRLSKLWLEEGRTEQARQAGLAAVARAPSSTQALMSLADAWTANVESGHQDDAMACQQFVERLATALPTDDRPSVYQTRLMAALGRIQEAKDSIQQKLSSGHKLSEDDWIQFASISESHHLGLENDCLAASQSQNGISARLAYAKAVAHLAANDPKGGLESFQAEFAAANDSRSATTSPAPAPLAASAQLGADDTTLDWDLARASYLELIRDPNAAAAWSTLAEKRNSDLHIQELVLSVTSVQADKTLSARCIDRIESLLGQDNDASRMAHARWLVNFGSSGAELAETRTLLDDLIRVVPDSAELRVLSARAYERASKLTDAVSDLRAAVNLSPDQVSIRLYLARLLEAQGDFDAVREQLDHFSDQQLQVNEQRQQAAALLAEQGQVDRAISLLEENARAGDEAETASLLLAQLYQRRNEYSKAQLLVDRLLQEKPSAAVIHFAAELLASEGKVEQARGVLSKLNAVANVEPGVPDMIRADFALKYESADGSDRALSLFSSATKAAPTNPLTWRSLVAANLLYARPQAALDAANQGLRSLPDDPTLLAIAQQPAMLTYAAQNAELKPLLLYFVKNPTTGSVGASALGAIYAAHASQLPLDSLALQLRDLARQNPRFAPLHVYLATLFMRLRHTDDAVTVASEAANAIPDSPEVAQTACDILLAAEHWPEALAMARRWRENIPVDAVEADIAQAKALMALRQPLEAINLLKPYVTNSTAPADGRILQLYANSQLAAGITPDLAALMSPLLDRDAAGRSQWMNFAVLNLPPAEAEGWLRRASEKLPDARSHGGVQERITLSRMYAVLASRDPAGDYADIARDILLPLAKVDRPDPTVLLTLANLAESQGNIKDAEKYYRLALTIQPLDPLAENNLSMLLARDGDPAAAKPFIDAAVHTLPDSAELLDTRAFVLLACGDLNSAMSDIREAVRLDPAQPRYRLRLIEMLNSANRLTDASNELRAMDAMPLDPKMLSPDQQKRLASIRKQLSGVAVPEKVTLD
jgi:tetratricopeptide (TPR) repeat protein